MTRLANANARANWSDLVVESANSATLGRAEVSSWRARIGARLAREETNLQLSELAERTQMILTGLALANTSKRLLNSCFSFFTQFEQALTKSLISSLGELMVAIKMVQETFRSVTGAVTEVCLRSGQHTQFLVLNIIQGLKKGLVSDKKYSDERIDILSCLLIAEKVLAGPVTRQRTAVATVAITLAAGGRFGVKEEDWGRAGGGPGLQLGELARQADPQLGLLLHGGRLALPPGQINLLDSILPSLVVTLDTMFDQQNVLNK